MAIDAELLRSADMDAGTCLCGRPAYQDAKIAGKWRRCSRCARRVSSCRCPGVRDLVAEIRAELARYQRDTVPTLARRLGVSAYDVRLRLAWMEMDGVVTSSRESGTGGGGRGRARVYRLAEPRR